MKLKNFFFIFIDVLIILLFSSINSFAKIVGNQIIFGSTISLTGKYSSKAVSFKDNNKKFIDKINKNNGIKIGGKIYKLDIIYFDDESNEDRTNQLYKRLIQNEGVEFLIELNSLKLSTEIKNLISENQLAIVSSYDALPVYIDAFTKVDSVNVRKIREYILRNN
jgi:branched-chain amino acid transport system substrate-binding protein